MKPLFLFSLLIAIFTLLPTLSQAGTHAGSYVTGCLTGPNDDGTFVLKRAKAKDVQVGGLDFDDFRHHVGEEVRVSGLWVKKGAQIGEKENAFEKAGDKIGTRTHFRATEIHKLSDTCTTH